MPKKTLKLSSLRHYGDIQVQKFTVSNDAFGSSNASWENLVSNISLSIEPRSGSEFIENEQNRIRITHTIYCRYSKGLFSKLRDGLIRVVETDRQDSSIKRYYRVLSFIDVSKFNKFIRMDCVLGEFAGEESNA